MPQIWRNPELPHTKCASDPSTGFHEQHRFLFFTNMAHCDRGQRLRFPVRVFELKSAKSAARYNQKKVIGPARWCDFPSKQHPIAAARKNEIGAFKHLPD